METRENSKSPTLKKLLVAGAINGAVAVCLGAFAAHGLKAQLDEYLLSVFKIGNQYHFYHALGMLLIGLLGQSASQPKWFDRAGWVMQVGILLFSGSLYLLAVTNIRWLGAITPLGGVCFIVSWLILAWAVSRQC